MKTNEQTSKTEFTAWMQYDLQRLVRATGFMCRSIEIHALTDLVDRLIFNVANPDEAAQISKEDFAYLACNTLSLLNMLTDVHVAYSEIGEATKEFLCEA